VQDVVHGDRNRPIDGPPRAARAVKRALRKKRRRRRGAVKYRKIRKKAPPPPPPATRPRKVAYSRALAAR
jgi:hypothetical protein